MGGTLFRLTVVAALAAAGCGGAGHDRAGGVIAPKVTVLTLATHDSTGVREWADAVRRLSHGSLRIVIRSSQEPTEAAYVRRAITDVRDGRVSLAGVPVRGYDALGVRGLDGLLAPFLIDSYALQRRVLASDLPTQALPAVGRLGVRGIAVLPGPQQRLLSIGTPMLAPPDYSNQEIGVHPSTSEAGAFRALGTTATELEPGGDISLLRGIETDLVELVANRYHQFTADETMAFNVSFWPRLGSIVMNEKAFAALSDAQREALRRAGRAALDPALERLERDEHAALGAICPAAPQPGSFRLLTAPPRDLAALRTAAAPVYRGLERSDAVRSAIAAIEAMKTGVARPPILACPGARSRPTVGGTMRLSTQLARTDKLTWKGTVGSRPLGRGRLELRLRGGLTLNGRSVRRFARFEARFARGTLRGCIGMAIVPVAGGGYRWIGGPGAVKTASRGLRRYAGASLRFAGATDADDLGHLGGGIVTDAPNGLRC